MAKKTSSLLNFDGIQSPKNLPVSIDLKKHFVKWSGTVLNLNLNDLMKSLFIKFIKKFNEINFH